MKDVTCREEKKNTFFLLVFVFFLHVNSFRFLFFRSFSLTTHTHTLTLWELAAMVAECV